MIGDRIFSTLVYAEMNVVLQTMPVT